MTRRGGGDALGIVATSLVAFAGIVLWPSALERWALAKELLLVIAALAALHAAPAARLPRWWKIWLACAFGVLTLAAALGAAPLAQLVGRWPRYEGILTLGCYALAVWLGARLLGGRRDAPLAARRLAWLRASLAIAMLAVALISALESLGLRPLGGDVDRPGSLLGNASDQGVFAVVVLALLLPATLEWVGGDRSRLAAWSPIGAGAAVVTVVLSQSRAAILVSVLVVIAWAVLAGRRFRWPLVGAGVGLAVLAFALPSTRARLTGADATAAASATNRVDLWTATLDLVRQNPVTAAGGSGFADAITLHLPSDWYARAGYGTWVESPHNLALQVSTAGGIVALALVGTALMLALRQARQSRIIGAIGLPAVVAIGAWAIALLTHFTSPGTTLLVAFLGGSVIAKAATASATPFRRTLAAVGLAAWASLLFVALVGDSHLKEGLTGLGSDPARAESALATARTLRPWDPDLPLMVAEGYAGALDAGAIAATMDATTWAEDAVERLPGSTRALVAQAIIAQHAGDLDLAHQALATAAELSPTDPQVFHRLGGILLYEGDVAGAVDALERAHELDPRNDNIAATLEYALDLAN